MRFRLNHIGMVVRNLEEVTRVFRIFDPGLVTDPVPDPIQKVKASFISIGDTEDVHIEIIEPTAEDSPVTNFLQKRGDGIHHLCFEVDDIDGATKMLVDEGFRMIAAPVDCLAYDINLHLGHDDKVTRIAFFLAPNRILVELLERGE